MALRKHGEGEVLYDRQKTAGQDGLTEQEREALQRENEEADETAEEDEDQQ